MTCNPPRYEPKKDKFPFEGTYLLKYRKPVPCNDITKYVRFMKSGHRRVRRTEIDGILISTVFLVWDHGLNIPPYKPVLFETMFFKDFVEAEGYETYRCCTWREALNNHWLAVAQVKANGKIASIDSVK